MIIITFYKKTRSLADTTVMVWFHMGLLSGLASGRWGSAALDSDWWSHVGGCGHLALTQYPLCAAKHAGSAAVQGRAALNH